VEWLKTFDTALATLGNKQSISDILDLLVKQTRNSRQHQMALPVITLLLATGQELTGVLLEQSKDTARLLTLARTDKDSSLSFIAPDHIIGITLHDANKLGQLSTNVNVPAKLELSRQAKTLGEALGVVVVLDHEDSDLSRLVMSRLLETLGKALTALQLDELGKTALRNLASIQISTDETGVRLEGNKLLLSYKDLNSLPSAEQLQQDIEALL
jgi:hypothetical protein